MSLSVTMTQRNLCSRPILVPIPSLKMWEDNFNNLSISRTLSLSRRKGFPCQKRARQWAKQYQTKMKYSWDSTKDWPRKCMCATMTQRNLFSRPILVPIPSLKMWGDNFNNLSISWTLPLSRIKGSPCRKRARQWAKQYLTKMKYSWDSTKDCLRKWMCSALKTKNL